MNALAVSFLIKLLTSLLVFLGPGLAAAGIVIPDIGSTANLAAQALISLAGVVWGLIEHNRAINLGASTPASKLVPGATTMPPSIVGKLAAAFALLLCLSPLAMTGCASSTYTYTPPGATAPVTLTGFGAWCENNLGTIQSAAQYSARAGATYLIQQGSTKARIASYIIGIEAALSPFLSGTSVTQADIEAASAPLKADTAAWDEIASPVLTLVGGYLVTLESEHVSGKVIVDVLKAVLGGFNAVSLQYASPTSL